MEIMETQDGSEEVLRILRLLRESVSDHVRSRDPESLLNLQIPAFDVLKENPRSLEKYESPKGIGGIIELEGLGYERDLIKENRERDPDYDCFREFSEDSLRLLARDLRPFLHDSTQDGRVVETALRVVQDPRFARIEARVLAQQVFMGMGARLDNLARRRYESVVVPALASTMTGFAWKSGLSHLGEASLDSVEAVRDQIDRVNFCYKQVREIIAHGKVRDAYLASVSPRAEDWVHVTSLLPLDF